MALISSESDVIAFRVPKKDKKEFERKYPSKGKRSKILRALLQMHMLGQIPNVTYKEA